MNRAFQKLELTEIKPSGWLLRQLEIQMAGLSGKLHRVWNSVGSYSGWLGGTGENWERAPYYLDGLVPLAYYLQDEKQWEICCNFIEWMLASQTGNGNFGPKASEGDYWSRFVALKVLIQFYEITKDQRVLPFFQRYFSYLLPELRERPAKEWARARIPDLIYSVKWLYEKEPDPMLLELEKELERQSLDWSSLYENFPYSRPAGYYYNWSLVSSLAGYQFDQAMNYHETHIVNVAMGLKYSSLQYFFHGQEKKREVTRESVKVLEKYHGVVSGAVNGDEHLAGNSPNQGSELCSVVEYMFSLQTMLEIFGEGYLGDRLERLAFNAYPSAFTEDYMAHQYDQQANQILVSKGKRSWFNNDDTANTYGLEPHFGCCTANYHQGWPKLVNSLWYRKRNKGFASVVFAPNILDTVYQGEPVKIELITEYPFRNTLLYRIIQAPSREMELSIRIPEWCKGPEMALRGAGLRQSREGEWLVIQGFFQSGDELEVVLPMKVQYTFWKNNSIGVEYGPLVFGLDVEENWSVFKEIAGIKDYEISTTDRWNYALLLESCIQVEFCGRSEVPFSKKHPPVILTATAKVCENWTMDGNNAMEVPLSPVEVKGDPVQVRLIPFGCTHLRISQFPYCEE